MISKHYVSLKTKFSEVIEFMTSHDVDVKYH